MKSSYLHLCRQASIHLVYYFSVCSFVCKIKNLLVFLASVALSLVRCIFYYLGYKTASNALILNFSSNLFVRMLAVEQIFDLQVLLCRYAVSSEQCSEIINLGIVCGALCVSLLMLLAPFSTQRCRSEYLHLFVVVIAIDDFLEVGWQYAPIERCNPPSLVLAVKKVACCRFTDHLEEDFLAIFSATSRDMLATC